MGLNKPLDPAKLGLSLLLDSLPIPPPFLNPSGLKRIVFTPIVIGLFLSGCALTPSYRAHPGLDRVKKNLKSIAFLQPRVEVFQIDAGGVREKVEEWSAQAQENLFKAIEAEIQTRSGITIYPYAWENLSGAKKTDLRNLLDDTHV